MKPGFALVLAFAAITAPCLGSAAPGYARLDETSHKDRPLTLSVWYPSDAAASGEIGGNAVFSGTPAAVDAPAPPGPLPLIVLSHGGLRSAPDSGAWLSASLAEAGAIVVEINAPRPRTGAAAANEIRARPQDISRAADRILSSPAWAGRIDQSRISAVGFALGGTAALMAAGAKLDTVRYAQSCDGAVADGPDCAWFAAQGIDFEQAALDSPDQPLRDSRFASAVAIAPEYLASLNQTAAVPGGPALLVSLGGEEAGTPAAAHRTALSIPEAAPVDAFAVCTKAGPEILREDTGDDTLCRGSGRRRPEVHRGIAAAISGFLAKNGLLPDSR